jgi:hypothetical protein
MFDLNMRLGFKPTPAWTEYRRPFDGAAEVVGKVDADGSARVVSASEGA